MGRAAVVYNPVAGGGRAGALALEAIQLLEKEGWTAESRATRPDTGAREIVRELGPDLDLLVVAGGDGSFREAVMALGPDSPVQVALLPVGNANVVARELGIPIHAPAALRVLIDGTSVRVDLGFANGEPFVAMLGAGWDARTLEIMERIRASRVGRLAYRFAADVLYVACGLGAYALDRGQRRSQMLLRTDGRARARVYRAAVVSNFRTYAKGWSMTPTAHHQSGTLHYQARRRSFAPVLMWHLAAAFLRRECPSFISDYGDGDTLVIESERPFPVQLDGDFRGYETRVEVSVRPAAVSVLVPLAARAQLQGRALPEIQQVAVAPR